MTDSHAADGDLRTALGDAQCIEIAGQDACAYAQAQFSGDVRALQPLHWQWNAWLDYKGAVRALMHLAWLDGHDSSGGRLLALLRGGDVDSVCAELRRYVLRARVRVEPLRGRLLSIGPPLPLQELRVEADAIGFGCGNRSVWLELAARSQDAPRECDFRLAEIRDGWPRLPRGLGAEFLPPALGLEHLGAVAFDKGCYPGQEIAARLHYRGGHKRRLTHVLGTSALRAGESLRANARDLVLETVETAEGWHALAVMDEAEVFKFGDLRDNLRVIHRFEA